MSAKYIFVTGGVVSSLGKGLAAAFTTEQAKLAGSLIAQTGALGLSLGDRACLALGITLQAPIYTADKSWKNLRLGVHIHLVR